MAGPTPPAARAADIQLCSGGPDVNAVCLGLTPGTGAVSALQGFFDDLSNFGQTTTLAGSTVTPVASTAPEPGDLRLLAAAGVALLAFGVVKRQRFTQPL